MKLTTGNTKALIIGIFSFFTFAANAQTVFSSKASGNWTSASTWNTTGSGLPRIFIIHSGNIVTIDQNISNVDTIIVDGEMIFGNNKTMTINSGGMVIIGQTGTMSGGSNNSQLIFTGTSIRVTGPFTSNNIITNGPRYANTQTVIEANGDPQGSFVSLIPLPVELLDMNISQDNQLNYILNWSVASEEFGSRYMIETSNNGFQFSQAQIIDGKNTGENTYSVVLNKPETNFYVRLSVVVNGKTYVLNTIYKKLFVPEMTVFPTVMQTGNSQNISVITNAEGEITVHVYTMGMQYVGSKTYNETANQKINLGDLFSNATAGNYVVVLIANGTKVGSEKIIITQ